MMKEALLYERLSDDRLRCHLCAHKCTIAPSHRGVCGVRENRDGRLHTLVYGMVIAENVDPIEKKPLFHVYPGSRSLSVATVGCNFRCTFCQNHSISQMPRDEGTIMGSERTPESVVQRAVQSGSRTIAYTYTEPTIFFEFASEVGLLARKNDIGNVFVSNGFMSQECIELTPPFLDAANIDLKSFSDDFYRRYCGARLQPVLDSLKTLKDQGIWIEITTLIIPDLNDSDEELRNIAQFIASLGAETPWHISRFHAHYKMEHTPPTSRATLHRAWNIGKEAGLKYVYTGNIPGDEGEHTFCASCGHLLIERFGFTVKRIDLKGRACPHCAAPLDGIL